MQKYWNKQHIAYQCQHTKHTHTHTGWIWNTKKKLKIKKIVKFIVLSGAKMRLWLEEWEKAQVDKNA